MQEIVIDVKDHLDQVKKLISKYEIKYNRTKGSVLLLAAVKKQPLDKIKEVIKAGQTMLGESYLQESLHHISALADESGSDSATALFACGASIDWHFIGHIQSNKTRKIAEHFTWVHSLSDMKIAKRLNDQRPLYLPPLNVCIEVNISHEQSKSGVDLSEVEELARYCLTLPHLKLRGLMSIPAPSENFLEQRKQFHKLAEVFNKLRKQNINVDTLSMGMTEDFEAAIAEGSTIVRIGTGIFGPRLG